MKRIFAILMTICLLAGALSITAFAADEPAAGTVMRVRRQSGSNEPTFVADYDDFETGWNEAMELADSISDRVIVDLYDDWDSDEEGRFSDDWINGSGFKRDTIYFQDGVVFTLNMNGHKIDRRLAESEADGEVMYIDSGADVTINNGTITGGKTTNGAGGIHVNGARLYLNDVCVTKNSAGTDNGGGIALYRSSKLVMNGGELGDNIAVKGAGVFLDDSSYAEFNNVAMHGNYAGYDGSVAYVWSQNCTIKFNNCKMYENRDDLIGIAEDNSNLYMDGCEIYSNYGTYHTDLIYVLTDFDCEHKVEIKNTYIHDNSNPGGRVVFLGDANFVLENVKIENNDNVAFYTTGASYGTVTNCTFNNNGYTEAASGADIHVADNVTDVAFVDCSFGDSTFDSEVKTVSTDSTGAVMGICVQKADGTLGTVDYYKKLEYGWTDAMTRAQSLKGKERVVVDLYADWTAVEGQFTDNFNNDVGFDWDAIHIPQNVRVTFNLNGHKIDRALTTDEANGEVICIDKNADVIINGGKNGDEIARADDTDAAVQFGTITGGWSNNGAGGIHIKDNATVVLNNVKVDGNSVRGDDGAAIAVYDGANLIMNGGSISNNFMRSSTTVFDIEISPYGALYANESTVTLNKVTLSDNYTFDSAAEGVAIYATESTVAINECIVSGNAVAKEGRYNAKSVIAGYDSKFIITKTNFTNNASDGEDNCYADSRLFYFEDSRLTMEGGKITQNNPQELLCFEDSHADINKVTITDNASVVIYVDNDSEKVNMNECTLNKNASIDNAPDIQVETKGTLAMNNCKIGDTNFEDKGKVEGVGSLFGEGSLTNILVIISLVASGVSIFLTVYYNKKKAAPVAANGATDTETDDEE